VQTKVNGFYYVFIGFNRLDFILMFMINLFQLYYEWSWTLSITIFYSRASRSRRARVGGEVHYISLWVNV